MELANIFADPNFRSAQPTSCYPNRQYINGETGALVVFAGRGQDFAVSKNGLERLVASTRIQNSYVVLAKANGGTPQYIASERAQTVLDRLRSFKPRMGKWGGYWWITANFMPVGMDDEEVF